MFHYLSCSEHLLPHENDHDLSSVEGEFGLDTQTMKQKEPLSGLMAVQVKIITCAPFFKKWSAFL